MLIRGYQNFLIKKYFLKIMDEPEEYKITAKQKRKLKKFINELEDYRGRNTELVTVYAPAGYKLSNVVQHLQEEQGTAKNIKSSSTRKNVISALEKMIRKAKAYKRTPKNGLALFSGNVSDREGHTDVQAWAIEPPAPLNKRLYRCDKEFVLEPLKDMVETDSVFGLVVLDRRDAMFGLLKGKSIISLRKTHSEVPGKMKKGGQSAQRFARIREEAGKKHFKKIAEYMKEEFLKRKKIKGIIIGGPSSTIRSFLNKNYITGDLEKKILGTKNLGYTGEVGLKELVDKSQDLIDNYELNQEKTLLKKFFKNLGKDTGLVSYGESDVMKKLKIGAVDKVLVSESVSDEKMDELEEEADKVSSEVVLISSETPEGRQLKEMGGLAALLRYPVHH